MAFVVDMRVLDAKLMLEIVEWCCSVWGGAYSPILPVIDGAVPPAWRELLQWCEPDVLCVIGEVDAGLVDALTTELQPCEVIPCSGEPGALATIALTRLREWAYDIDEFPRHIATPGAYGKPWHFLDMRAQSGEPFDNLSGGLNLGVFPGTLLSDHLFRGVEHVSPHHAVDAPSLLNYSGIGRVGTVGPLSLAGAFAEGATTLNLAPPEYGFTVVIGDSPDDWLFAWTLRVVQLMSTPCWWRRQEQHFSPFHSHSLWLPRAQTARLASLASVTRYAAGLGWLPSPAPLRLASASLSTSELAALADTWPVAEAVGMLELAGTLRLDTTGHQSFGHPELSGGRIGFHRFAAIDDVLTALPYTPPVPPRSQIRPAAWMVDVDFQAVTLGRPHEHGHARAALPRRHSLAELIARDWHARIDRRGGLCVRATHEPTPLSVWVPTADVVIEHLLSTRPTLVSDGVAPLPQDSGLVFNLWTEGRDRLDGLLNLFGSFRDASAFMMKAHWRGVFQSLGGFGKTPDKREKRIKTIRDLLTQVVTETAEGRRPSEEEISGIAEENEDRLSLPNAPDTWMRYEKLEEALSIAPPPGRSPEIEPDGRPSWKRELDELITKRVLFRGLELVCRTCRQASWYEMRAITEHTRCAGCGAHFQPPSDPANLPWAFRLNELAARTVRVRDDLAVLLAARRLDEMRAPFMWATQVDVYRQGSKEKWTDLDLIGFGCRRGCRELPEMIVVDVKASPIFKPKQIRALCDVCTLIHADTCYLSCLVTTEEDLAKLNRFVEEGTKANSWGRVSFQALPIRISS